ncbi:hypothetical protein EYF80_011089 [Liparis tanakae]|uniref:Uncharacterized protein n=1 Tax=Liparis tanakae TaxID=230148 RepID=A0A4Z2ILG6_9TELE|nr:hypothetical protein EYF80_011089 [Liparis tanakae]
MLLSADTELLSQCDAVPPVRIQENVGSEFAEIKEVEQDSQLKAAAVAPSLPSPSPFLKSS